MSVYFNNFLMQNIHSGVEIPSPKKNSEGNSLLELKDGVIKVQTFGHIKKLLRVTKESTKKEIKVCLESLF